ncbi:hypothetical protein [Natrinema sp. HArc-T2]|uniref:hypothetical protein n=1 Tax=Natrinema sp. HArc-T2 TaxID=3242701 RepID=UPI00359CC3A5
MTNDNPSDSSERDGTFPRRRTLLGAIGALTGATALTETGTAQGDGTIRTRGCNDAALTADDWSTGAVTVQACSGGGGRVTVRVTGRVGENRYVATPANLPSSRSLFVPGGDKRTLWFTGQLVELSCSNDDLNIGIANRS